MDLSRLRRLVAQGEGPALEFKKTTGELRPALEALCGMLNDEGRGRVVFGISNDGEIRGQEVAEKTIREIANLSRGIEPAAEVKTERVRLPGGLEAVLLEATPRAPGPFTFEGRSFLRVGNTTQRMSHSEFDRRVVERLESQNPWDGWIAPDWKVRDLDADEIHRMVEAAVEAERLTGLLGEKVETILRRLELLTDRGVTRAAAILFRKEGAPAFPKGQIRLARFRGTTKDEFRDNRQYDGHAFDLFRHAERFLSDHVPIASTFVSGKMERVDTPRYPPLAVREALINALIHRDYSVAGGAVSVAFFDDRLEVWSTGTLPHGLTPEKLKGTHESKPRNPLIAGVFHRRGLIEQWGRGTNKILDVAKRAGCPEPEFEEVAGSFIVRFWPAAAAAGVPTGPGGSALGDRVLEVLHRSAPLKAPDILRALGEPIPLRTLQRELRRLREARKVLVSGSARATAYRPAPEGPD